MHDNSVLKEWFKDGEQGISKLEAEGIRKLYFLDPELLRQRIKTKEDILALVCLEEKVLEEVEYFKDVWEKKPELAAAAVQVICQKAPEKNKLIKEIFSGIPKAMEYVPQKWYEENVLSLSEFLKGDSEKIVYLREEIVKLLQEKSEGGIFGVMGKNVFKSQQILEKVWRYIKDEHWMKVTEDEKFAEVVTGKIGDIYLSCGEKEKNEFLTLYRTKLYKTKYLDIVGVIFVICENQDEIERIKEFWKGDAHELRRIDRLINIAKRKKWVLEIKKLLDEESQEIKNVLTLEEFLPERKYNWEALQLIISKKLVDAIEDDKLLLEITEEWWNLRGYKDKMRRDNETEFALALIERLPEQTAEKITNYGYREGLNKVILRAPKEERSEILIAVLNAAIEYGEVKDAWKLYVRHEEISSEREECFFRSIIIQDVTELYGEIVKLGDPQIIELLEEKKQAVSPSDWAVAIAKDHSIWRYVPEEMYEQVAIELKKKKQKSNEKRQMKKVN